MKKISIGLLCFLNVVAVFAQEQYSIPATPRKIEFANIIVQLDDNAFEKVNQKVIGLLTPQNAYLDAKLEQMQWYFPFVENILEEEGVPDDMKYLMVQESGLKADALSRTGAVGYWQMKEPTAKELGLRVDNDIDERKYLFASTKAAALYFKKNNIIFKNWLSSMMAYNQGPTGAAKILPAEWSYANEVKFTDDTPDYLITALSHRIAFEHRLNRLKKSPRKLIVYPTRGKSLAEIAVELTVDLSELRTYNSWLNAAAIPVDKEYFVLIPIRVEDEERLMALINRKKDLHTSDKGFPALTRVTLNNTSGSEPILYKINDKQGILAEPGDEAAQLARKAEISLPTFLKYNDLTDKDLIMTGKVYYLEPKNKKAAVEYHTASKNQTLWEISQNYGVRLKSILKYNRLKKVERLQPGRVVWLQRKRPKNQAIEIINDPIFKEEETTEPVKVKTEYEAPKPDVVSSRPSAVEPKEVIEEPKVEVVSRPRYEEKKVIEMPKEEAKPIVVIPRKDPEIERKRESELPKKSVVETHKVTQGETLFSIAKRYGISVKELRAFNNMSESDVLKYGQVLKVTNDAEIERKAYTPEVVVEKPVVQTAPKSTPPVAMPTPAVKENTSAAAVAKEGYHIVQKGETLFSIAKMYNIELYEIKAFNSLENNDINVGQSLRVRSAISGISTRPSTEPGSASVSTHIVEKGQTLFSISRMYNLSVERLKALNNLSSNEISIGQSLRVK